MVKQAFRMTKRKILQKNANPPLENFTASQACQVVNFKLGLSACFYVHFYTFQMCFCHVVFLNSVSNLSDNLLEFIRHNLIKLIERLLTLRRRRTWKSSSGKRGVRMSILVVSQF